MKFKLMQTAFFMVEAGLNDWYTPPLIPDSLKSENGAAV
ncbi:hypothetical protein EVA_09498 [gut metagenome]|uniref:Uncharacterized protein n=1 Tax=gut metagenome TaxID=749906 RepID=J9G6A5_9ZZZZ